MGVEGFSEVRRGDYLIIKRTSANALRARHDGLVRGTLDLQSSCQPGQVNCDNSAPHMSRYDGYRSFEEPVSDVSPCIGPRGLLVNESHEDAVWAYEALAKGVIQHRSSSQYLLTSVKVPLILSLVRMKHQV